MADEPWKTNDLAMATYLKMMGHTPQRVGFEDRDCWWFFLHIPALTQAVDDFLSGRALVTPQEYNKQFGITKREMADARSRRDRVVQSTERS
jgi:hypothetical protein